jgi:hypothetical protein
MLKWDIWESITVNKDFFQQVWSTHIAHIGLLLKKQIKIIDITLVVAE